MKIDDLVENLQRNTKQNLAAMNAELTSDIKAVEKNLRQELDTVQNSLLRNLNKKMWIGLIFGMLLSLIIIMGMILLFQTKIMVWKMEEIAMIQQEILKRKMQLEQMQSIIQKQSKPTIKKKRR